MSRGLWYGQIRPSNFDALCQVYGYFPPWPMSRSPHVDLVHALADGRDPSKTAFADYLCLTGRPDLLLERVNVLRGLMASEGPFEVDTCCGSVLDGNHRTAVAIVRGQKLIHNERSPYQTIKTSHTQIPGRRLDDRFPLDYDFAGKVVLDLGARDGMNAVHALEAGAKKCVLVDSDFTSLTWRVMHECGFAYYQYDIIPADLRELPVTPACDVVLAFSIRQWIGDDSLASHIAGKDCILETHTAEEVPPATGHKWRLLKEVAYSRNEPDRKRCVYLGTP